MLRPIPQTPDPTDLLAPKGRPFLTAQWRWLVLLNYEIDPQALASLVPPGVEIDEWDGRHYLSVVGFRFLDTRVLGFPIPFHRDFDEVNLRFYVRRKRPEGWVRGVVFVREIVPRRAVAIVANTIYGENYITLPMRHTLELEANGPRPGSRIEYAWRFRGEWNRMGAAPVGEAMDFTDGCHEQFIAEHYRGYARHRRGGCAEYRVEHPAWRWWRVADAALECDVRGIYGDAFAEALSHPPSTAFLAEGSAVTVYRNAVI